MHKHAYLIMAYDKFDQLAFQISLLDDPRNDIFIHIDKRSPLSDDDIQHIQAVAQHSTVYFTPRMAVYWGDFSLVECELRLYQFVAEKGPYAFYHLISGTDLPLRSQDTIHAFFADKLDKIFITRYNQEEAEQFKLYHTVEHYHFFRKITPRTLSPLPRKLLQFYQRFERKIQTLLRVDRLHGKRSEMGFDGFSQWKSFNHEVLMSILRERPFIEKHFHHTFCSDEYYLPMVLKRLDLLSAIYHYEPVNDIPDEFQGNLRYINWWDGRPYEWTDSEADLAQLDKGIALGHLFSRKFNLEKYPNLKEYILNKVNER
ncbi:beta-1,6-N-acetylglucosaminyltransferase [Streptococcus marmotae]|uniref:beta-1,6-N-acetylglucosaminyltransferase n=1 Tax=Streptococcus marmotae TaxID=1825069 RepID=UPI0008311511|nr:beta-1,6-N-acetylglucosaminyltransferase [Streptococcus marmotae]